MATSPRRAVIAPAPACSGRRERQKFIGGTDDRDNTRSGRSRCRGGLATCSTPPWFHHAILSARHRLGVVPSHKPWVARAVMQRAQFVYHRLRISVSSSSERSSIMNISACARSPGQARRALPSAAGKSRHRPSSMGDAHRSLSTSSTPPLALPPQRPSHFHGKADVARTFQWR